MRWEESGGGGYGLVQWTPASKLINWCNDNNLDYKNGDSQIKRIIYEKNNNIQWFNNPISDIEYVTWEQFTKIDNLEKGVKAFMYYYENPASWALHLEERIDFAKRFQKDVNKTGGGSEICYTVPIKDTNISPSSFTGGQLFGTNVGGEFRPNGFHNGLDFGSIDHPGNQMLAICDGEIVHVGNYDVGGLYVWYVLRGEVYDIHYWESATSLEQMRVSKGDKVKTNQLLSIRNRDHLHLSVTKDRDFMGVMSKIYIDDGTWINPLNILNKCFNDGSGGNVGNETPDEEEIQNLIYLGRS